ncbi:MAG: radical SAM protein [bacterium]
MLDKSKKRYRMRIIIPAYPAFNIYSFIANKTTALGPVSIASVANKIEPWDVEVIDENNLRNHGPKSHSGGADHEFIQRIRPADIVGFYGGITSTISRLYSLAKFYKEKGVITIAGGQHFIEDNFQEALSSNIDYIVRGEGELVIKELLEALVKNKQLKDIKGLVYKENEKIIKTPEREALVDFDTLPLPDFSLVRYAKIDVYPIERIRGCGMNCEFCTVSGKPRCATPERFMDHISQLVETRAADDFFVVDDLFGQERNETLRFLQMVTDYQKRIRKRLEFTVQIRLDKARDSELLKAMRWAGVTGVAIGFESPIEEELKAMNKKIKPDEMVYLARQYNKFGFLVHGMFIFAYPHTPESNFAMPAKERVKIIKRFINKAKIDTVQILLPVPLPGTRLRNRLDCDKRIYPLKNIGWEYYDGNFPVFEPDIPLTSEEMQHSARKIMGKFYRFNYMFKIVLNIFSFPALIFYLHNLQSGWMIWYRSWRNNIIRFGGWVTIRKWTKAFHKDKFSEKLKEAKNAIISKRN